MANDYGGPESKGGYGCMRNLDESSGADEVAQKVDTCIKPNADFVLMDAGARICVEAYHLGEVLRKE